MDKKEEEAATIATSTSTTATTPPRAGAAPSGEGSEAGSGLLASPLPLSASEDGEDQPCALSIADDGEEEELAPASLSGAPRPTVTAARWLLTSLEPQQQQPVVSESVVSAAEGLSSLIQTSSPAPSTPSKLLAAKRKRKEPTPVKGRHVPRRKVRREQAAVTVKDHKIPLDEAASASLYKLTRLWMDDGTQTINQAFDIAPSPPNGGMNLPPPEPHNAQSSAKRPGRPPCQSPQDFDRLISGSTTTATIPSGDEDVPLTIEQLKDSYVHYAKALRVWFCVQRAYRLRRYTERWKLLASTATLKPPQP